MKTLATTPLQRLATAAALGIVFLLAIVPFHALLSVWASGIVGHYDALRLWKDMFLVVLTGVAAYLLCRDVGLLAAFRRNPLFWLMGGYVGLHVVLGLWALATHRVNSAALLYALVINLRLVAVFFAAWVIASKVPWLHQRWALLALIPAIVVVVFGLLQAYVLPADALRHIGYGPETIPAFQTVDQKPDYVRLQSTLRGPNPLGAYLVFVLAAVVGTLFARRLTARLKVVFVVLALATCVILGLTYSRSAYLGAVVAIITMCWLGVRSERGRQALLIGTSIVLVIVATVFSLLRENDTFQNVFFHTDETSQSQTSSNENHASALKEGMRHVLHEPLGRGPGTAGPASTHNLQGSRLSENYYLQIGQEVGWLGLGLFVAINAMIVASLWYRRHEETLAIVLLASFAGLTLISMLSHAWSDDVIAYVWWGLAGVALAYPAILNKENKARNYYNKVTIKRVESYGREHSSYKKTA